MSILQQVYLIIYICKCFPEYQLFCPSVDFVLLVVYNQVILIKTIRLSMKLLPEILENILDLKIVHLVRDPRAILHSREGVSDITYFQIRAHARGLCNRIKDDMESGFLQNVFRLKYECLIFDTINTVKQLFTNLNLIHTNSVDDLSFYCFLASILTILDYLDFVGRQTSSYNINNPRCHCFRHILVYIFVI
jgi:hypothetical protein